MKNKSKTKEELLKELKKLRQQIEKLEKAKNKWEQVREELQKAQERFSGLYNSSKDAMGFARFDGTLLEINNAFCELTGYSKKELLAVKKYQEITPKEYHEYEAKIIGRIVKTGKPEEYEKEYIRKDGSRVPILLTTFIVKGADGKPIGMAAILKDITERKRAEEALRKSKKSLKEAQRIGHVGSWDLNTVTGDLYWSDETYRIYGFKPQEFVPTYEKFLSILNPDDKKNVQEKVNDALQNKRDYNIDFRFLRPDKETGWIHCEGEVTRDKKGKAIRFFGVQIDITERKKAEEALRIREQEFRTLVENAPDVISRFDSKFRHIYINPVVEKESGMPPEFFIGKTNRELGTPEDLVTQWREAIKSVFKTGQEITIETKVPTPDGIKYYSNRIAPEFAEDGSVTSVLNISRNITSNKQAEEALLESEEQLRLMVKNSLDVIFRLDMDKGYTFMSPSVEQLMGYHPDDYYNDPEFWRKITHPDDIPQVEEMFAAIIEGKDPPTLWELRQFKKDGSPIHLEFTTIAIRDEADKIVALEGVARDITERKQAEEALRESDERFRVALTNTQITVFTQDRNLRFTWAYNPLPGFDSKMILGKTDEDLVGTEQAARTVAIKRRVLETGKGIREELSTIVGEKTIYYDLNVEPLFDSNGEIAGIVCASIDITERKKMEEQIARSSRLAAMGEMIGGAAHELNNPLTSVLGNTQWLLTSKVDPKMLRETLQKIERSAQKTRKIVADLLEFTREKAYKFELADINDVVRRTLEMFQKQADISHIEIRTNYKKNLPLVNISASHIEQIFLNIMTNASQAMPEGGNLTVNTCLEEDTIQVKFQDTGVGIETEDLDKIFNPFYTKKVGSTVTGTGLGLSMAHKIIGKHKGTITAQSEGKGKGATFTITLPVDKEGKSRK